MNFVTGVYSICLRPPPLQGYCLVWSTNCLGSESGQIQSA
jgi:hypothetical protein